MDGIKCQSGAADNNGKVTALIPFMNYFFINFLSWSCPYIELQQYVKCLQISLFFFSDTSKKKLMRPSLNKNWSQLGANVIETY